MIGDSEIVIEYKQLKGDWVPSAMGSFPTRREAITEAAKNIPFGMDYRVVERKRTIEEQVVARFYG